MDQVLLGSTPASQLKLQVELVTTQISSIVPTPLVKRISQHMR